MRHSLLNQADGKFSVMVAGEAIVQDLPFRWQAEAIIAALRTEWKAAKEGGDLPPEKV